MSGWALVRERARVLVLEQCAPAQETKLIAVRPKGHHTC